MLKKRNLPSDFMVIDNYKNASLSQLEMLNKFTPDNIPEKYHIQELVSRNNKLKIIPSWEVN